MIVNPSDSRDLEELARAYCRKYSSTEAANNMADFHVFEEASDLVRGNPTLAFAFILQVLAEEPNDFAFANLAAGPLEDLLVFHGKEMIDAVEKEAKQNPDFDDLLGGVWLGRMKPDIAERVAHARSAIWKD